MITCKQRIAFGLLDLRNRLFHIRCIVWNAGLLRLWYALTPVNGEEDSRLRYDVYALSVLDHVGQASYKAAINKRRAAAHKKSLE